MCGKNECRVLCDFAVSHSCMQRFTFTCTVDREFMYSGIVLTFSTFSVISAVVHNENTSFGAQNTCIGIQHDIYMPEKCLRGDFSEGKKIFLVRKKILYP